MAKVRIPVEQLPPPDKNGNHIFQFRIISEDRNISSPWSNLYEIKSIGQYRPLESDVTAIISSDEVSLTWDTPTIYNYYGSPSASASMVSSGSLSIHNHSQNFKQHDTDVFVQWGSGSVMGNFEYHDRISNDSTNILVPESSASARFVGLIATKNVPQIEGNELEDDFRERFDTFLGISGSVSGAYDLFKIFDTGVISL
jgi:hypothetical protein